MDDFRLPSQEIAALKKKHKEQRDKRLADRINAILLLSKGWSRPQVAEILETVVEFALSVTKESTLRLCRRLLKKHPFAKSIHIWLDGASYYTSPWLREKLKGTRIVNS